MGTLVKITQVSGRPIPLRGNDIDTDRIIPARFMKCVTFDGLGEFAFYDVRKNADGSDKPHPAFPDLPPLASVASGFNVDIWVGVFAPAGTPAAIVDRLNREINAVAASPELTPVLEPDGTLPEAISASVFASRIKTELGQWKKIATEHKIVAE